MLINLYKSKVVCEKSSVVYKRKKAKKIILAYTAAAVPVAGGKNCNILSYLLTNLTYSHKHQIVLKHRGQLFNGNLCFKILRV